MTVPEELLTRATEIFERMLKLAVYYFAKHPTEGALVGAMNGAPGHRKLANHLLGLAELYARHPAVVTKDTQNYRATDEADARKAATEIVNALSDSSTPDVTLWTGRCARAWSLLSGCYGEVQSLGRWLLRATPEVALQRFPSLVAEARGTTGVRKPPALVVAPPPGEATVPSVAVVAAAPVTVAATPKRKRHRSR